MLTIISMLAGSWRNKTEIQERTIHSDIFSIWRLWGRQALLSWQQVGLQSFLIFVLSFSWSQLISVCRDNKTLMMFTDDRLSFFCYSFDSHSHCVLGGSTPTDSYGNVCRCVKKKQTNKPDNCSRIEIRLVHADLFPD